MTAEPGGRSGPGPLIRALGRAVNSAVARFPWSWRLLRGPVRRFFDSVAVGWDERVRSDLAEYLMPLQAALDRLPAGPLAPWAKRSAKPEYPAMFNSTSTGRGICTSTSS